MGKVQKMCVELVKIALEAGRHPELLPIENASQADIAFEALKKVYGEIPSTLSSTMLFVVEDLRYILREEGDTAVVYRHAWAMSRHLRISSHLFGDDAEGKLREATAEIQMLVV